MKDRQNNFFFLLSALLFLLLILPVITDIYGTRNWLIGHLAFSVTLIFSVVSLHNVKKWRVAGLILVFLGITFSGMAFYLNSELFLCFSLLADFLFLLLVISMVLQRVIFSDRINLDNVAGAICVYLLLGIIWSLVYYFINIIMPGSFKGNLAIDMHMQSTDFIHYSFVTLTTLGYGDIVPMSATARSLSYMEAIFGQFYIVILVAGLVAIHITTNLKRTQ
ncbi:MAG: two pore domain potassium channel family protein [Methylococcales bacterium]|nr:two pore domain potassium channel family protein [Methylococcales bacterium]